MNTNTKPLIIAVALAFGASSGAFAQSPSNTTVDTQNKVVGKTVPGSPMNPATPSGTMGVDKTTKNTANMPVTGTATDTPTGAAKNPAFDTQSEVAGKAVPGAPGNAMTDDKMHKDKKHADKARADKKHMTSKQHAGSKTDAMAKKDSAFDTQSEVAGKAVPGSPDKAMNNAQSKDRAMSNSGTSTSASGQMGASGKTGNSAFNSEEKVDGKAVAGTPTTSKTPTK